MPKTPTIRPFKRGGLHRLECDCSNYTYATVAALETHGRPVCPCGETFTPERLELCMLLGLETADAVLEYERELSSVTHGQAPVGRSRGIDYKAEPIALERVERRRSQLALKRRLTAIAPVAEPLPF